MAKFGRNSPLRERAPPFAGLVPRHFPSLIEGSGLIEQRSSAVLQTDSPHK